MTVFEPNEISIWFKNCHNDHIPFNVKGNGNIVFSLFGRRGCECCLKKIGSQSTAFEVFFTYLEREKKKLLKCFLINELIRRGRPQDAKYTSTSTKIYSSKVFYLFIQSLHYCTMYNQ